MASRAGMRNGGQGWHTVPLPDDLWQRLQRLAEKRDLSVAYVARELLTKGLSRAEAKLPIEAKVEPTAEIPKS